MVELSEVFVRQIVSALVASTVTVVSVAATAVVAAVVVGRHRVAVRHLILVAALAASVAATLASLSTARLTVEVPWWREATARAASGVRATNGSRYQSPHEPGDWDRGLAWLWLAGIACVALRVTRQAANARSLRGRAVPVTDATWTDAAAVARATTGCHGPFALLVSSEIDTPFVTGLTRPAVVIPSAAADWSAEEKRSVLAHELAHLTRHDLWTRAVATTACALHWFNPLVWWIAAWADRDSELAADYLAVRSGILPSTYANALLSLAERISWRQSAPAGLAFFRRSSLAPRIRAVLAPRRQRPVVGSSTRLTVIGSSCAIAVGAGCVKLAPRTVPVNTRRPAPAASADTGRVSPRPREAPRPTVRVAQPPAPVVGGAWIDDAVEGLVDALDDPSPNVRMAAANSLHRFDTGQSRAVVERALGNANVSRETMERMRTEKQ